MSYQVDIPPRPYLPPTLYIFLVVVLTEVLIAYAVPWYLLALELGFILLSTLICFIRMIKAASLCLVCLCAALAGAASAHVAQQQLALQVKALERCSISKLVFHIESDPYHSEQSWRCKARVALPDVSEAHVWLTLPSEAADARTQSPEVGAVQRGSVLNGVGRFSLPTNESYAQHLKMQGIAGVVSISHIKQVVAPSSLVDTYRSQLLGFIDPQASPERSLLAGVLCGYRSSLKHFGVDEELALCGLAHLVAVSGSHLSVVTVLCAQLLSPFSLSIRKRFAIITLVTGLFVVFCGFPASAVRAWIMVLSANCAQMLGRRTHSISAVCAVATFMALVEPSCVGDLGYLLSVTSVFGLCTYSRYAGYVLEVLVKPGHGPRFLPSSLKKKYRGFQRHLRASLASSVVAQVSTAPLCLPVFGRWSFAAPLTNAFLGPIFVFVLGFGCLALLLRWIPLVSQVALTLALLSCKAILFGAHLVTLIPGTTLMVDPENVVPSVLCVLILVSIVLFWPRLNRNVLLGGFASLVGLFLGLWLWWGPLAPPKFVMLDIGQGDALLIRDGMNAILIDTGPDPDALLAALARQHVMGLDAVVLTHLHADHCSGVQTLCDTYRISSLVVSVGVSDEAIDQLFSAEPRFQRPKITRVLTGDTLSTNHFRLEVLWPSEPADGTHNEDSLVMRLEYVDRTGGQGSSSSASMLLTGDAEQDVLAALAEKNLLGKVDVLKVGHHGSEVSLTPEFAQVLSPNLAIISVGEHNKYGHPTKTCLDILQSVGAQIFCTKDWGDLVLEFNGDSINASTQRSRAPPGLGCGL